MGEGYGPLARALHWFVAFFVFILIPLGLVMTRLGPGETQDRLFVLHESLGVTTLALMLLRVANRWRGTPPESPVLTPVERRLSGIVHPLLYALLLVTPVVGWFALSAFGLGPSVFGVAELPALIGKNEDLAKSLFNYHLAGALAIAALALLHIAGALRHALRRDGVVARMAPFGRRA